MGMTLAEWLYIGAFHLLTLLMVFALGYWVYRNDLSTPDPPGIDDGGIRPAPSPSPARPRGGLPLPTSTAPYRRLHPGEQLGHLHEHPQRREHAPTRTPAKVR
jgi:hypothetical protein